MRAIIVMQGSSIQAVSVVNEDEAVEVQTTLNEQAAQDQDGDWKIRNVAVDPIEQVIRYCIREDD